MLIKVAQELLTKYPQLQAGYVVAKLNVKEQDGYTESLKSRLEATLRENKITKETYEQHGQIVAWRNVFKDMGKNYKKTDKRSSLEALVKRIVTGQRMFAVNDAVDLYNACSVLSMVPAGAFDIDKLKGNIYVRYGRDGEKFEGLGKEDVCAVEKVHVVYADDAQILTWLWNYRDAAQTAISLNTKHAIFFLDTAYPMEHGIDMRDCLQMLADGLEKIGSCVTDCGILSAECPEIELDFAKPVKRTSGQSQLLEKILNGQVSIASTNAVEQQQQQQPKPSAQPKQQNTASKANKKANSKLYKQASKVSSF
jgi:DNA/RNA-binding domain of Phe-tRNA-synthetase-like protein